MEKMEKKFWWFSKKNDSASDFDEVNNGYYDSDMSANGEGADNAYDYSDTDVSDVSVVLSGDPSKDEPLMKRTFTPESCQDSADIVDAYKQGRVIVICVEELDKPNFMRLFDYLMGAVQALDGSLERIDRDTVVLLPYGVEIDDVDIDELEEEVVAEDTAEEDIEDEDDEDLE
jgi:cell division inhibitor SepF